MTGVAASAAGLSSCGFSVVGRMTLTTETGLATGDFRLREWVRCVGSRVSVSRVGSAAGVGAADWDVAALRKSSEVAFCGVALAVTSPAGAGLLDAALVWCGWRRLDSCVRARASVGSADLCCLEVWVRGEDFLWVFLWAGVVDLAKTALWARRCVDLARSVAGRRNRAASARRAGIGAFKRIVISEARNARAISRLEKGWGLCK